MGTDGGGETDRRAAHETGDYLSLLRGAADALEAAPGSEVRGTFFPNWPFDENELDKPEVTRAIRRAARAVFARKTETGEGGRRVSKQELSHLIHYLASMLE
jgi:hypothetical protein